MEDETHVDFVDAHQVAMALTEAFARDDGGGGAAVHGLLRHAEAGELELIATAQRSSRTT